MAKAVTVVINQDEDERVVQQIAATLRSNDSYARQIRDFADTLEHDQLPQGIRFQPQPGQILICHFGLGFEVPENVKTRPVLVISPHQREWTRLCVVVPISSLEPDPVRPYHFRLPRGVVPGNKYEDAWLKGDMVVAVGCHRLDRIKIGRRQYEAPLAPPDVLREARRCVLHAAGMHALTPHW